MKQFRTYQLALALYRECETLKVPYHMRDQLSRASLSVCLNLAEGCGKPMGKDRRQDGSKSLQISELRRLTGFGYLVTGTRDSDWY